MTKQLYLSEGMLDYDNSLITEDRYIIVNEAGYCLYGQHFTEEEADNILSSYGAA